MKKFVMANLISLISVISSLILAVTLYGYEADQKLLYKTIASEKSERVVQDSVITCVFIEYKEVHEELHASHELKHEDEENQRIERDALLFRYLESRFDGVEKLIDTKN